MRLELGELKANPGLPISQQQWEGGGGGGGRGGVASRLFNVLDDSAGDAEGLYITSLIPPIFYSTMLKYFHYAS